MHEAVGQHLMPFLPVPDFVGVELQPVYVQCPREAQDAYEAGDGYDNKRDHTVSTPYSEHTCPSFSMKRFSLGRPSVA